MCIKYIVLLFILLANSIGIRSQKIQDPQHPLTISFAFSDGFKSYLNIASILKQYNFNATFFVNSANITFQDLYLNVFDINQLVELGFEIGGHTFSHTSFIDPKIDTPTILEEICRDRATLIANGWKVKSFAYTDGFYKRQTQLLLEECGYNSALAGEPYSYFNRTIEHPYNFDFPLVKALEINKVVGMWDGDPNSTTLSEHMISFLEINNNLDWIVYHFHDIPPINEFTRFLNFLLNVNSTQSIGEKIVIKSINDIIDGDFQNLPLEFKNTPPTYTPDPLRDLKIYIGTSCLGALVILIFYVCITTSCKRKGKCKKCCC